MSRLRILNSSLSRRDPVLGMSALISLMRLSRSLRLKSYSLLWMDRDHMTVIKTGDWLEDFILEVIGPMFPRVVRSSFLCSIN